MQVATVPCFQRRFKIIREGKKASLIKVPATLTPEAYLTDDENFAYPFDPGDQSKRIKFKVVFETKISAKGLDYLDSEGGLTAKLNTVTVKFDADALRALFLEKVETSNIPAEEKSKLRAALQSFPLDALRVISQEAMKKGGESLPDLMGWVKDLIV